MKFEQFEKEFEIIANYYGKEEILQNKELINIYFDSFKYVDIFTFNRVKELAIKKCKFFPKVSEFEDFIQEARKERYSKEKREQEILHECEKCKKLGYILYWKKVNDIEYLYACACDCKNGDNKLYEGPQVKDPKGRSNYYIKRFSDVFGINNER